MTCPYSRWSLSSHRVPDEAWRQVASSISNNAALLYTFVIYGSILARLMALYPVQHWGYGTMFSAGLGSLYIPLLATRSGQRKMLCFCFSSFKCNADRVWHSLRQIYTILVRNIKGGELWWLPETFFGKPRYSCSGNDTETHSQNALQMWNSLSS